MVKKRILPVTRVHEPMKVEVEVNNGVVTDAWVSSTLFRGFELMLQNRDPRDTTIYVQRICGICSTAHAKASALALEDAYNLAPPPNGFYIRNLILGADFIQNHLRQFYVLALPDYARGPDTSPFRPVLEGDYRIPAKIEEKLFENYWKATEVSAKAHQMVALWGAKAPHQQTILPGGVTEKPHAEKINMFTALLKEADKFVTEKYIPDVYTIAEYYPEYFQIGRGYGNLISYGMFPESHNNDRHFKPGLIENFARLPQNLEQKNIVEEVDYSYYKRKDVQKHPFEEDTDPDMNKPLAYTWVKCPRYQNKPFESGPLARLWINKQYQNGVSVLDRIITRALETKEIIKLMFQWLEKIDLDQPTLNKYEPLAEAQGIGLVDSMRGNLGHWVKIEGGRVANYQVITPSTWNFSPRDHNNQRGPVEEALVGTPVANLDSLIEVGRVIRSYDPCFSCSVHLVSGDKSLRKFQV